MPIDPATLDTLQRRLRRTSSALLLVAERLDPIRFILDPASGRPVFPAHADAFSGDPLTLHVPDDTDLDALHLLGTPAEIDPRTTEAGDRWHAYHLKPPFPRMLALELDSIKTRELLIDAADASFVNPLRWSEPSLCRLGNADPVRLARLCERCTGTLPASPLMVGMDPWGLDLRARLGVIRVEFEEPARDPEAAPDALRRMLDSE